jgi:hypothetical protein
VLDGRAVEEITAFLFHEGGHDDPLPLRANAGKSFQGSIVLGMGFTFDDMSEDATPIADMDRLITKEPKNRERIFPYLGGEEVNDSPTHAHRRYVINFDEMDESEARRGWPDLMQILDEKVRPERSKKDGRKYPRMVHEWWKHFNNRRELFEAIRGMGHILAVARHQPNWCVGRIPSAVVPSEALVLFALEKASSLAILQSRVHEAWARFFGSSMKDDLRYTPTDCFETFPLPEGFESHPRLEAAGKAYYEFRADLMVRKNEGLTKTYNRFHDPDEQSADIKKLRELHAAMDRSVLDAYGWIDLQPTHEFLLDYEVEEAEEPGHVQHGRKPWRYRWPDAFRDEVLARLLRLNQQRADEEGRQDPPRSPRSPKSPKTKPGGRRRKGDITPGLFGKDGDQ